MTGGKSETKESSGSSSQRDREGQRRKAAERHVCACLACNASTRDLTSRARAPRPSVSRSRSSRIAPPSLSRPSLATLASRLPHERLVRAWMHTAITPSLLSSDPHVRPAAASLAHSLDGRTTLLPLTACRLLFHCPSVLPSGLARLPPPPLLLPPPPPRSC